MANETNSLKYNVGDIFIFVYTLWTPNEIDLTVSVSDYGESAQEIMISF